MSEIIIILSFALLLLIAGVFLFNGKGKWLIAGFNTASKEEKSKYDEKKLCKAVGFICVVCSFMLCIMAYLGYRVNKGLIDENMMLPFGFIFAVVVITTIIIASVYANTKAKK